MPFARSGSRTRANEEPSHTFVEGAGRASQGYKALRGPSAGMSTARYSSTSKASDRYGKEAGSRGRGRPKTSQSLGEPGWQMPHVDAATAEENDPAAHLVQLGDPADARGTHNPLSQDLVRRVRGFLGPKKKRKVLFSGVDTFILWWNK
jgi:hypothetical protein